MSKSSTTKKWRTRQALSALFICIWLCLAIFALSITLSYRPNAAPEVIVQPSSTPTMMPPPRGRIAAFPGAEGFGTETPGGRGGRIIYVTSRKDAGPGSLRAALEASGPRLVLFRVAGTITLKKDITITQPFITIAGQTAPGDGVQIRGGMIKVKTHDVVIRYLKMRSGDRQTSSSTEARDAISLSGTKGTEIYNLVIDHCSMVWGPDIGGIAILTDSHDITIQNSILGEGLYYSNHPEGSRETGHSKGLNITKLKDTYGGQRPTRITMHHNLFTTSDDRMPQIIGGVNIDIVNNVIYNWGKAAGTGNPVSLNLIKNMFIKGPETRRLEAWTPSTSRSDPMLHEQAIYEEGNVTEGFSVIRGEPQRVYSATRFTPYSIRTEQTPQDAYTWIVREVGATRPVRDSVDQRIIENLRNRTGRFLDGTEVIWPKLESGPVPADTDQDGMPDAWEQQHFDTLSRGSATNSSSDFDQDGYTDVEEYLNQTDPTVSDQD
jgi:pectate lyase